MISKMSKIQPAAYMRGLDNLNRNKFPVVSTTNLQERAYARLNDDGSVFVATTPCQEQWVQVVPEKNEWEGGDTVSYWG
jgi:hypothetical protein